MSQGQQRSPHEDIIMFVIVAGLVFGVSWVIWQYFHEQLTNLVRYIRIGEMWVLTLLHGNGYTVFVPQDADIPDAATSHAGLQNVEEWRKGLWDANVKSIGSPELRASTYIAVPAMRPVFAVFIGAMSLWAIFRGPNTRYRRKMTLEGLIKEQARAFPTISPFIKFNPRDMAFRVVGEAVPSTLPMFAEALSPEEWIAYNEIQMQNNQVDINQTYRALMSQLGTRWQGPLKLPIHAQGLYAAFALRHARKRKECEELLGDLALHWTPDKGLRVPSRVRSKIMKIIKDPKLGGSIQKYADNHAYTTTALLRCLQRAREEGGVMAPASFLWLRGEDRKLWYPLNNLGRRSYHAEAVGALVHYSNELIAGQKIPTPRYDEVIKGIQDSVTGPMSRPIPPLERVSTAKFIKKK